MPKKPYARIAITLPRQDLAEADRLAVAHDRSRSWIIAEALRRFAAEANSAHGNTRGVGARSSTTKSSSAARSESGIGSTRLAQLRRDLALTPTERVREAEETLRLTEHLAGPKGHRLLAFDRYEDFLDWKRARDLGR